jgi:uncharacterized membrane protein
MDFLLGFVVGIVGSVVILWAWYGVEIVRDNAQRRRAQIDRIEMLCGLIHDRTKKGHKP